MVEFTDEYFINLTMDYDKRDDEIYPKWAVWCAKSNDRYYIDGKDGHFYTHERTDEEIAIERKKRELIEFVMEQRIQNEPLEPESEKLKQFMEYEEYIRTLEMDENFLEVKPKTFEEWNKKEG